ncbi:MAG: carboxypeptidase regulatory-like domain-containing protein [Terriglobia bacterium]
MPTDWIPGEATGRNDLLRTLSPSNNRRNLLSLLLVTVFVFAGGGLRAQSGSGGTVKGHVAGPGSVAVPGARIILFNTQTRARKETWSDVSGNFAFEEDVPPGQYRLVVMLVGFRPSILGPVDVVSGKSVQLNASVAIARPGELPGSFRGRAGGLGAWAERQGQPGQGGRPVEGGQPGFGNATRAQGQFNSGAMGQSNSETLNSIMGETEVANGAGSASLRFSENSSSSEPAEAEEGAEAGLGGAAGSNNSFLLTGNTVDATAPAMRRRGGFFHRRFILAQGGGPAGVPGFGGGMGGGPHVFFFGGRRRPGVNRIRGSIFDYYSNSALNARPYPLNTPSQPQIPYYSERVGITLGGPLSIPKIYKNGANKTSFFVHYNTTRAKSPFNLFDSVPTAAERAGDFSTTTITSGPLAGTVPIVYEPSSNPLGPRTPFPGNVIPASMFNTAAKGLLSYIPLPNVPGEVQNLHLEGALPSHNNFIMGRIGQEISAKDNLAVFYFYNSSLNNSVNNFPELTSTASTRNQNVNALESHTFSPHMVNMLTVNFNRSRTDTLNPFAFKENVGGELGIQGISEDPMNWGIPEISFTNFTGLNDTIPSLTRNQTVRLSDFVILNHGNHNLHLGGDIAKIQLNTLTDPNARGTFDFSGYTTSNFTPEGTPVNGTGYDFADFLLGLPQTTSVRYGTAANYLRSSAFDAFGNDDWRILSHLTLDLGLRWEYDAPFTEKYGHLSDLALGPDFSTVGVVTGQNPDSLPPSLLRGHADNLAPRVGLAYRPWIAHSLVVRAGYGIFYDESIYGQIVSNMTSQPPFATTSTLVTSPTTVLTLENGFPAVSPETTRNTYAVDPNFMTPYAESWNVMLEQDLGQNFVLSTAYVGTHGTHLNLLLAPVVSSADSVNINALPFIYDTSGAASSYDGLRISLRRFSHHGFSFFVNYTYSKAMDDAASVGGSPSARVMSFGGGGLIGTASSGSSVSGGTVAQNPFDLAAEWGLSGFNPTHSLHLFTRYQLPFGDRKPFLNHGGVLARLFGNWAVSDITSFSSGLPLTAFISGNLSNNVSGSAPFSSLRANATGLPVLPTGFERTPLVFFNTTAFALPATGEYGNAGRNTIPGPPSLNFSTSLDRIIYLSNDRRRSLDFRIAANNAFNIVNFSGLATTVNSNTFGRVTGVGSMRTLNFSVRLRF